MSSNPKTVIRRPRTSKRKSSQPHKSPQQDSFKLPTPFPASFRLIALHVVTERKIATATGFESTKPIPKKKPVKRTQANPREPTSTSMRVSRSQSRKVSLSPPPTPVIVAPPACSPTKKRRIVDQRRAGSSPALMQAEDCLGVQQEGRRSRMASPLSFGDGSLEDERRPARVREEPGHLKDYA